MQWFNESCRVYAEQWTNRQHPQRPAPPPPLPPPTYPDRVLVIEDEVIAELGPVRLLLEYV